MNKTQTQISKLISYWLRHKPQDGNIQLDPYGWANIEDILLALKENDLETTLNDLVALSNSFDKIRWKIDVVNKRIKATHGHSISIKQELEPQIPPEDLYHGTASRFLESIMANGLKSQQRQYVHLSETVEMAKEVGSRHGEPFILEIYTKKLSDKGYQFYKTEENVWLTSDISSHDLSFGPWYFSNDEDGTFLNELKKEVYQTHPLYEMIEELQLVARYGPSDDCLFMNTKTSQYFVVHLTWSRKKERDGYPWIQKYHSLKDWIQNRLIPDQKDYY